MRNVVVSV